MDKHRWILATLKAEIARLRNDQRMVSTHLDNRKSYEIMDGKITTLEWVIKMLGE